MNVPKLRFKEFNNLWQNEKLEDAVEFLDEKRKPIKDSDRNNIKGKYPYYGASGIIDYINDYIFDEDLLLLGEDGANILSRSTKLVFKATGKYWVNNHAHVLKPKENYNINFLESYLENINYESYNTGTAQPKLNQEVCKKINIKIPSLKEQEKIGKTLSLLDKKIELQSKKIEDLKLFKSSKYSLVFSKSNNKIKLLDICKIEKGKQINSELLIEKGNYYMLNGGILPSGLLNEYNTNENTITISEGGNSCGYVNFNKTKFWCGGHCYKIISSSVNTSYLYHLLKHNEKTIMDLRVGSGLPNIQKKDLEALKLSIHENDEQLKIGILFDTFDKKINLETNKLNKFKELKKGLMQQMFV